MAIQFLSEGSFFPDPVTSDENGLVAIGGSLSQERLIESYSKGIFPWYSQNEPIMWWSPDPRIIIFPHKVHISKTMKKLLKKKIFSVTINQDFEAVINNCRDGKGREKGTWITDEMKEAYINLHANGYAHSVEVRDKGKLIGGLYGITLGKFFFGESMFFKVSDASKYGFIKLAKFLEEKNFILIDGQVDSEHLRSLGGELVSRSYYLKLLKSGLRDIKTIKTTFPKNL